MDVIEFAMTTEVSKNVDFLRSRDIAEFLDIWLKNDLLPEKQQAVFDNYYKSYKNNYGAYIMSHYANQTIEVMDKIHQKREISLLEVGAGCGTEALWFALNGATVKSIDLNSKRLEVARERKKILEDKTNKKLRLQFEHKSIFEMGDDEKFDLIWMEQAFHHVEPRNKIYGLISNLLKPKGVIIISEANAFNPFLQLQLIKKRGFKTIKYVEDKNNKIIYGDERITIPQVISHCFSKVGIQEESVRFFRVFPNIRIHPTILSLEEKTPKWFLPIFTHYNYVGKKL